MAKHTPRRAISLLELLVAIAIIGILLSLTIVAVMQAREASRNMTCKSNLRQLGIALQSYHSTNGSFPCGAILSFDDSIAVLAETSDEAPLGAGFHATGFALLLPYIGTPALHDAYDMRRTWDKQPPQVVDQVIPLLICPSVADNQNPFAIPKSRVDYDVGDYFGATNYLFSKGVFDGWCLLPRKVRPDERGMFDVSMAGSIAGFSGTDFACRSSDITDGLSQTFAMGEGAGGSDWMVGRTAANNAWAVPPRTRTGESPEVYTSTFASTIHPLNMRPVAPTEIVLDFEAPLYGVLECNSSRPWKHDGRPLGVHSTSNFRSAHSGGANFLYADGSVRWMTEAINMATYRALSTIAGAEVEANSN